MARIEKINLHVGSEDAPRRVCRLSFARRDCSIYLIPFAPTRQFFTGVREMDSGVVKDVIKYREEVSTTKEPKLSIHESGQVHVEAGGNKLPNLLIPELRSLSGEHIATVVFDRYKGIPVYDKPIKLQGRKIDRLIGVPADQESGKIVFYLNGKEPRFKSEQVSAVVEVPSSADSPPVYLGLLFGQQNILDVEGHPSVTVISGWDPRASRSGPIKFLFVEGV